MHFFLSDVIWAKEPVDLVIRNAHIVCLDGAGTQAQAMAIHEGQIVALGKEHEILNAYRGEIVEDAQGATVYPGLIDAHSHLIGLRPELGCTPTSWERRLGRRWWTKLQDSTQRRRRLGCGGGDGTKTIGLFPSFLTVRPWINCFPNRPVALQRIDGHAVIANRHALELTRLWEAKSLPGGEILRRADGTPTGVLVDGAADSLLARIPEPSATTKTEALRIAAQRLVACGLTTVTDAGLTSTTLRCWIRCTGLGT